MNKSTDAVLEPKHAEERDKAIDLTAGGFNIRSQADINRMNALQAFQGAINRSKKVKHGKS
ncbi:hypothetical protein VPHD148_0317 [Vibrio phage D148]